MSSEAEKKAAADAIRKKEIGFIPQKENIYLKHLPYAPSIDKESNDILADIKSSLGRAVQLRDLKYSVNHWACQLSSYIRLYGYKFSKEDHVSFVKLFYELIIMPDLDMSMVLRFSNIFNTLLKKRSLLSKEDLVIPWKPLYELLNYVTYTKLDDHALVLFPDNAADVIKQVVIKARIFFPAEATQEILDEFRPLLCPFDVTMNKGMYFLAMFLPTVLSPEEHEIGFGLWFEEFMNLWLCCDNNTLWDGHVVSLFCRLSYDCCGYIDWNPYIPQIFTRILRCLDVPLGSQKVQISRSCSYDPKVAVPWIVNMMGGKDNVIQKHLDEIFHALDSCFHPSNHGKWTAKLHLFISKLSHFFCKRLHRERYRNKHTWEPLVPKAQQLTDDEITHFVKTLCPITLLAMFSKSGSNQAANTFQHLANLRPEIVIPPLLERVYPSLETLTEPHRLVSCLNCMVAISRPMLTSLKYFPEGRKHIIPLLNLVLPGIDTNDHQKSLVTMQFIAGFLCYIPIVDCSPALQVRKDLTDVERELCNMTIQWEDFLLNFLDRVFLLIEGSSQEHSGPDGSRKRQLSTVEVLMEGALISSVSAVAVQCSTYLYEVVVERMWKFVTSHVYEIHVAGRLTAGILRAVIKVHPRRSLPKFMTFFTNNIISRCEANEDLHMAEKMEYDFLWSLKMLTELVRCDGIAVLPYRKELTKILNHTLSFRCLDTGECAGMLLRQVLRTMTTSYNLSYSSTTTDWEASMREMFPIREWGATSDPDQLKVTWHVPSIQEVEFASELLRSVIIKEINRIYSHIETNNLTREELKQLLENINHCIVGGGAILPAWSGEPIQLVESMVERKNYKLITTKANIQIDIKGTSIRRMVVNAVHPLVDYLMDSCEDDTKSLHVISCLYSVLVMYHGSDKSDFDNRWKGLKIVKKALSNKVFGGKRHLRSLLVDRVQLQHDLRVIHRESHVFTDLHKVIFDDLFRLSTSRYSEVRKTAQRALNNCMQSFPYSFKTILPALLPCLRHDPSIRHHQFKGALYLVLGDQSKRCLIAKRDWDMMCEVWPAIIKAQHSEKNSILVLMDAIMEKLSKLIETTEINTKVTDEPIEAANLLFNPHNAPRPSDSPATSTEMDEAEVAEEERHEKNAQMYNKLVADLLFLIRNGTLGWKFYLMALEMIGYMTRHDIAYPQEAVELCTENLLHDSVKVRQISIGTLTAVLWSNKQKHKRIPLDPYKTSKTDPPADPNQIRPGDRPDNLWLHYNSENPITSKIEYDTTVFVEKTHWGYYTWPKNMWKYAPVTDQPRLGRTLFNLPAEEMPIYKFFTNSVFFDKFIFFMTQEEEKKKCKFRRQYYLFFKGLFRNYDVSFLDAFKAAVDKLLEDKGRHQEHSHRLAAEIITGMVQGSKHWDFERVMKLWTWLEPTLQTAMANVSTETITDWGTAYATMSENRDPRKLYFLFRDLMEKPIGENSGAFSDEARLYCLQGALSQQEWRVPDLLNSLKNSLEPHLAHNLKLVRDRIGSVLVNIFLFDIHLPQGYKTKSPHRREFIELVLPKLKILKEVVAASPNHSGTATPRGNGGSVSGTASPGNRLSVSLPGGPDANTLLDVPGQLEENTSQELAQDDSQALEPNVPQELTDAVKELVIGNNKTETGADAEDLLDEHNPERKEAIRLCKTVMQWLQGTFSRSMQSMIPEFFKILPVFCAVQNERRDPELKQQSIVTLAIIAHTMLPTEVVPHMLETVKEVASMRSWHARVAILNFVQVSVMCNLFMLRDPETVTQIENLVHKLLLDEHLEVRQAASVTLGGLLHCGYLSFTSQMLAEYKGLCRTKVSKKRAGLSAGPEPDKLIKRHAGVLGLCSFVQAYPYDVPPLMPEVLMILSGHVDDPQPIQGTVKNALSQFKRTHYDNWQDHKQKFSEDQLVVLTDMLISPSYYA